MDEFIAEQNLPRNVTTELINEAVSPESFTRRMFKLALAFDAWYTPLLCLVGTLGNSLSLAVFNMDAKYRSQSASFYLSALAVSDTGFLFSLFAVWLEGMIKGGGVITSSDVACSLVMYVGQVTCFLSVYLTVAFSIERYVAVHYPFSRPRICTRAKARKVIACLTVLALVIFSYAWVIAKVVKFPSTSDFMTGVENTSHYDYNTDHTDTHSYKDEKETRNHSFDNSHFGQNDTLWALQKGKDIINTTTPHKSNFHENDFSPSDMKFEDTAVGEDPPWEYTTATTEYMKDDDEVLVKLLSSTPSVPPWDISSPESDHSKTVQPVNFKYYCSVPEHYFKVSQTANFLDTAITMVIPFFLIAFFNIQIATCVWRLKSQRQSIVATPSKEYNDSRRYSVKSSTGPEMTRLHKGHVLYRPPSALRNPYSEQSLFPQNERRESCRSVKFEDEAYADGRKASFAERKDYETASRPLLKSRLTMTLSLPNDTSPEAGPSKCRYTSPEVRVTKTLLLVSSVFLVLNLPSHLCRCALFIQELTGTVEGKELLRAIQPWANILFNTNFAVNFLLYCVSGKNFRLSLHNLFLRTFRRGKMTHHRRKVIKERLHPTSRCCSTTLTTGARESCATSYLRIELGNVDESYLNGRSLNNMNEDEIEQIAPV